MKKRTVIIGLIILILGFALVATGSIVLRGSTTSINTFSQPHSGEYVSTEIVLNASESIVVRSPASVGGIVPAQDVDTVSSANLGSYAVPYTSSIAGIETYRALAAGNYYYVAFSSTQPSTRITVASGRLAAIGLLVLAGVGCIVIGIIVTVVGALQNRVQKAPKTYEYKYPDQT